MNWVVVYPDKVQDAFVEAALFRMPPLADEILGIAISTCPVDTGFLDASHDGPDFSWGHFPTFRISNLAPYAAAVHEGARPHIIRAVHAPVLHFFWEKRGVVFRGKTVNHPGNGSQPWLRNAMNAVVGGGG